jgi:SRSO17 transposase
MADHRIARREPSAERLRISSLPADTTREALALLARLRWMVELDYKQLKGELGLERYEGRSYRGFHHHCTLVRAAHGFLTLARADPIARGRPDTPQAVLLLQPVWKCATGRCCTCRQPINLADLPLRRPTRRE